MSSSEASTLTPDEIVELFPQFVTALEHIAGSRKKSPADIQSEFWHRAVHTQ